MKHVDKKKREKQVADNYYYIRDYWDSSKGHKNSWER